MAIAYQPYIDPNYESLIERIYPPRVCIDNKSCHDCTLVKVDSANKHGILLEMVQVLTDLDLVISKSYISSDGGWFMDVFHVTDQLGNKLTDESLLLYIQQALCATRREGHSKELQAISSRRDFRSRHVSPEQTALEMSTYDRTGLLSELSAVLTRLECNITASVAWTHHARAACIIYVEDEVRGGPITDPHRLACIEAQLETVVGIHSEKSKRQSVRVTAPVAGRTHTERRLHQLMFADGDYEQCHSCGGEGYSDGHWRYCKGTHVTIESWKQKGYSVVNVRSRDRPKLLFDTVCALTDMNYVVSHASISSEGSMANQEYFIRLKDGCTLDTEKEKQKLTQCLVAAIERRISHGLRVDITAHNRAGLLSDVTRIFRENGLSIIRADIRTRGERALGSFYVTDTTKSDVDLNTLELLRKEVGGSVLAVNISSGWTTPQIQSSSSSISRTASSNSANEERLRLSFGSLIWSKLERISSNFGPIRL